MIYSTFFIVHTNYIVYFWLSVRTTMQPALDSLKIQILRGVNKAGREQFWKHQNPKCYKKFTIYVLLVDSFFVVVRSQQNPMYECNFESSLISNFFVRKDFIVQIFQKSQKKTCPQSFLTVGSSKLL